MIEPWIEELLSEANDGYLGLRSPGQVLFNCSSVALYMKLAENL
jgi:hypothetical protein